jgi:sodium transport system permease protein
VLTSSPKETLLLKLPQWKAIPAALLLAVFLHPLTNVLQSVVTDLYPVSEATKSALDEIQQMFVHANIWQLLLVLALVPAVCEELAFRGFVLSGFRHVGYKWRAIFFSAFFFGVTHGILQQSLLACLAGVIMGYLAVQSGSILPCMVFHVAHNSLAVLNSRMSPALWEDNTWLEGFILPDKNGGCTYPWSVVIFTTILGLLILGWFNLLPYRKTAEETLQEAINHGDEPDNREEDISISLVPLVK